MLFDRVCDYLSLVEKSFFGLTFIHGEINVWFWLDLEKPVFKQLSRIFLALFFYNFLTLIFHMSNCYSYLIRIIFIRFLFYPRSDSFSILFFNWSWLFYFLIMLLWCSSVSIFLFRYNIFRHNSKYLQLYRFNRIYISSWGFFKTKVLISLGRN